jgi:hypothetical protein
MTTNDENEIRAAKEHRQVKELRLRVQFLERQLSAEIERRSHIEQLLHEALRNRYWNEHKCSAAWLAGLGSERFTDLTLEAPGETRRQRAAQNTAKSG